MQRDGWGVLGGCCSCLDGRWRRQSNECDIDETCSELEKSSGAQHSEPRGPEGSSLGMLSSSKWACISRAGREEQEMGKEPAGAHRMMLPFTLSSEARRVLSRHRVGSD